GAPDGFDPAEAAVLERSILDFPIRVASVMVLTSVVGYGIGALQLRVLAQTPVTELVKVGVLGIVTGLTGALFGFLYLESLLAPLTERFGTFGGAVLPAGRRLPLHQKVFACALITTLSALILLGTIFYSRGERVLEEQLGDRVLGEARHLATLLDEAGSRGLRREPPPGALPGPPLLAPPDAADRGGDGDGRPDRTGTRRPVGDGPGPHQRRGGRARDGVQPDDRAPERGARRPRASHR